MKDKIEKGGRASAGETPRTATRNGLVLFMRGDCGFFKDKIVFSDTQRGRDKVPVIHERARSKGRKNICEGLFVLC